MYNFCQVAMIIKIYPLRFFKVLAKLFYEQILIFLKCEKIVYAPRQKSDFTGVVWYLKTRCRSYLNLLYSSSKLPHF
jgi:hypothetical protein